MAKVIILMGSHPRHHFLAKPLFENYADSAQIIKMQRESVLPDAAALPLDNRLRKIYQRHFNERLEVEDKYFGTNFEMQADEKYLNLKHISPADLNSAEMEQFLAATNPDIVISIGIHVLKANIIKVLPEKNINVHLGLSPRYRGDATLFWPTYNLEPWNCGTTFHKLTELIDGGEIYHQTGTNLSVEHGVHETAAEAVKLANENIAETVNLLLEDRINPKDQKPVGRSYFAKDFRPEHLVPIYEDRNNKTIKFLSQFYQNFPQPKLHLGF